MNIDTIANISLAVMALAITAIVVTLIISFKYGHLSQYWNHPVYGFKFRVFVAVLVGGIITRCIKVIVPVSYLATIQEVIATMFFAILLYIFFYHRKRK